MAQIRLYDLIEYIKGTEKRYLMTDAHSKKAYGIDDLPPDSPEWFAWLATLSSFHFKGRLGHFTARYESAKKRDEDGDWYAYRKAYGKQHKRYLGTTSALMLAKLEQTAQGLHTAVLGSLPEDEVLNRQVYHKPDPQGLTLGSVTFFWHDEILKVQSPTGTQYLTQRQAADLLAYLYEHRTSIIKIRK